MVSNITINIARGQNIASLSNFGILVLTKDSITGSKDVTAETFRAGSPTGAGATLMAMLSGIFNAQPGVSAVQVLKYTSDPAAILTANNDGSWYAVLVDNADDTTVADIKAISDWCETNQRFFYCTLEGLSGAAPVVLKTTGTNYVGDQSRTAMLVHTKGTHPEATHLSRYLATGIGIATPAPTRIGARLTGQTANTFTVQKNTDIINNNGNVYVNMKGIPMVNQSLATDGSVWSETFEGDWIADVVETDIVSFLSSSDRVPYTDNGIQSVSNVISEALVKAGRRNMIDLNTGSNPVGFIPTDADYRFGIHFLNRSQINRIRPQDITSQTLRAENIWYYRSGNISKINLTILYREV